MNEPFVSIILRSFNEGWALKETLASIKNQDYKNWELVVIDSGSTDGSIEMIRKANPAHLKIIKPEDYNPSKVLNWGMQTARSEYGIFLNADATPQNGQWLKNLVIPLQDPKTAAVFGRQIPRTDCKAVYACDYDRCFGENRESARWEHFFSMVSSGLRKDIWTKRGFLEKLQYAEDDEYTRWCVSEGFKVVYCPESVVMHSHNYTVAQAYKRSFGDARASAASYNGNPDHVNVWLTLVLGWASDFRHDIRFSLKNRRLLELPHAALVRWAQRRGKLAGFKSGWKEYRGSNNENPSIEQPIPAPLRGRL